MKQRVVIIGGGAAGFFAAVTIAESNPEMEVIILEKSKNVLQKVKVSGGGRCNVTHACFTPQELVENYPRGKRELLGPFHQFMTGDTMEWFESRGVSLKIEADNRIFPVSNNSQTIIDCLQLSAQKAGVQIILQANVNQIEKQGDQFKIVCINKNFLADKVLITTGSSPKFWDILRDFGHAIIAPVPSLFTFNIQDERLKDIPGISVPNAQVQLGHTKYINSGALLITHWGLSGPAVLKLSAFAAIYLAEVDYQYQVKVNWLGQSFEKVFYYLQQLKSGQAKKTIETKSPFEDLPKRLWLKLVLAANIQPQQRWAEVSKKHLENLANQLTNCLFHANGKSIFKEEFVTAGGVDLKEINFKRFESKVHKNLFFAGEVLNIDAITGGYNFQNAWTGAYIAGNAIAKS